MSVDDVNEAYNLIKDLEPTTPQEYILKGVVNAALGQEQGSVCQLCIYHHSIIHDSVQFTYHGGGGGRPLMA